MSYEILSDNTTRLSLEIEKETIVANYFSVFDTDTFEADSMSLVFNKEKFLNELKYVWVGGRMAVSNGEGMFAITKRQNSYDIDLVSGNHFEHLKDIDADALINIL